MRKDDLLKKYKLKVLVEGQAGAGKTYFCVKCAEAMAKAGKKVLYLDVDDGAVLELISLCDRVNDGVMDRIDHTNIVSYKSLYNIVKSQSKVYDLIIIDILYPHLQDWCRLEAKEAFLNQGYYKIGEKVVKIDNPETFDLAGFMYQIPNNWEKQFFKLLRAVPCHIIATAYDVSDEYKRNMVRGSFDVVLQIFNTTKGRVAKPIKVRADPKLEAGIKEDYINAIIKKLVIK